MPNLTRVGIVGTGWVGSSVAISALHAGVAQELLLHDANVGRGRRRWTSRTGPPTIRSPPSGRSLDEMQTTDAVVIAAGRGGRTGIASRSGEDNVRLVRGSRALSGYPGVLVVTNPVDVLTREVAMSSGCRSARHRHGLISTGAPASWSAARSGSRRNRFRAQVVSEHGDSEAVLWSSGGGASATGRVGLQNWRPRSRRRCACRVRNHPAEGRPTTRSAWSPPPCSGRVRGGIVRCRLARQDGALGIRIWPVALRRLSGRAGASTVIIPELSQEGAERSSARRGAPPGDRVAGVIADATLELA
jgi:L-lactate dehydrogenase